MRQRWLLALLVLSLAVNAGVLGSYGVSKYRDWRHFRLYARREFKPGTTMRQLDRLDADLFESRAPYSDTLHAATREVGLLALEPSPDSARVNAALDRIARAARERQRLYHVWWQAYRGLFRPERQEFWRNYAKVWYDSILQADSATAVQPKEGR